jgi:hypothetical protein
MAVRMTPDQRRSSSGSNIPSQRASGGGMGGGVGNVLPLLLGFLIKRPKLLLVLLLLGGLWWFFSGRHSGEGDMIPRLAGFTTGADLDPAEYDKAEVYEPLADNVKNPLPERVSLERFCPPRLDQGQQGSCVAWASAYAARTIIQAQAAGSTPGQADAFSPAYMYNQIKIDNSDCQGSYLQRAMEQMSRTGALPFSQFAYTDKSCSKQPTPDDVQRALPFRIKGYQRLSSEADPQSRVNMLAMKQQLAQGAPIVIGMMVGGSFMQDMQGREAWIPTQSDVQMRGFGGHAMCVVGYDDYKFGDQGGFLIMNSWGPEWGRNGMAWVPYDAFDYFTREAFAVYPMGDGVDVRPSRFDIAFGFAEVDAEGNATGRNIPVRQVDGNVFRTVQPVAKKSRFKIEVTNNAECYTYVFGQEATGEPYVLFPYTPKHSPYCGITGTRLFPSDHSLEPDEVGDRDQIAILVTNQPFDYPRINELLKASTAQGLKAKLDAVIGNELATDVQYRDGATIGASSAQRRNALAIVLELDKQ